MSSQQTFIKKVAPLAQADMKKNKILASLTIAQAILESNWGNSGLTKKGNALFGIKAGSTWKGKRLNMKTGEVYEGKPVTIDADFRAYASWEESVSDHSKLLTTAPRYQNLIGVTDYERACFLIKKAGYATDPDYTAKLVSIIKTYKLYEYDTEVVDVVAELSKAEQAFVQKVVEAKLTDGKNPKTPANQYYVWNVVYGLFVQLESLKKEIAELKKSQGVK